MEDAELERRAEIARRLKAARWLQGATREASGPEVAALSAQELAMREPLKTNKITANRIGTIERAEHHTPPMELEAIAAALGVRRDWFSVDAEELSQSSVERSEAAVAHLLGMLRALGADLPEP